MKFTKISLVCIGALALFGCNAGSNTTTNDVQNITASVSSNNGYNLVGLATNCRVTPNNCSVSLQYTGTGTYVGKSIAYMIGTTSYPLNCNTMTSNQQSCNFTITGSAGSNAQQVTILVNNNPTAGIFTIGGGMPN